MSEYAWENDAFGQEARWYVRTGRPDRGPEDVGKAVGFVCRQGDHWFAAVRDMTWRRTFDEKVVAEAWVEWAVGYRWVPDPSIPGHECSRFYEGDTPIGLVTRPGGVNWIAKYRILDGGEARIEHPDRNEAVGWVQEYAEERFSVPERR